MTNQKAANDKLKTPEWVTSQLGPIDLDPCAGENTKIGAMNYAIERGENGLSLPWHGFVFCNPPFSEKELWAERMKEHRKGVLLLPERGSAPWFLPLAKASDAYWVMGKKINFIGGSSSNNVGTVLFLFGKEALDRLIRSNLPGHMAVVTMTRRRQNN